MMDLTEALFTHIVKSLPGMEDGVVEYQGQAIDFTKRIRRVPVADAVMEKCPELNPGDIKNATRLREICGQRNIHAETSWGWGGLLVALFGALVGGKLMERTFVTECTLVVSYRGQCGRE